MESNIFAEYPDCLNVSQLRQLLCIGKNTAYKLLETGQIKHKRLGKKYLIPKIYVIEYLLNIVQ